MSQRAIASAVLSLFAAFFSTQLAAQSNDSHPWLDSKFIFGAGAVISSHDYTLGLNGNAVNSQIDFDEVFGVDDHTSIPELDLRWNFGEKWSVQLQGFKFDVSGRRVLLEDVKWRDVVFRAGSEAGAGVKTSVARAFFGRKFSAGPRHEFGAGLGVHWLELEAYVAGEVRFNDETTGFRREQADAGLPLPNIGGWYWYSPSPRWLLTARVDWLSASVGDYSGSLWNAGAGAQFQFSDHWGLGLEYAFFRLDGDVKDDNFNGEAEISSTGPMLTLTANW